MTTGITVCRRSNMETGSLKRERAFVLIPVFNMMLGVYGWMKTALGILHSPEDYTRLYAGILILGLWFGILYAARKWIMPLTIVTLAGFAGTVMFRFAEIREGVFLLETVGDAHSAGSSILFLLCIAFLLYCIFLFALFSEMGQYLAILTMAMIVSVCLFFNQLLDTSGTISMIFSAMGLVVSGATEQTRARSYGALVLGVTAAVLLLLGNYVVQPVIEPMFADSAAFRARIQNTSLMKTLSELVPKNGENTGSGKSDGKLNAADSFSYTGQVMLTATVLNRPENTMYLKSYTGAEYTGEEWAAAADEEPVRQIFYERAGNVAAKKDIQEPDILQVTGIQEKMVPYYSTEASGSGNSYYFYDINTGDAMEASAPDARTDDYRQSVYLNYLEWPEERLERMEQYVAEHPCNSVAEICEHIRVMLDETADYNLNVGRFPEDTDFVEYFLFERREGYCVHFATAAVLLFRMYGVPARYATGYLVPTSDFQKNGDGSWEAEVKDERAHAWAEIYLNGLGWVPLETTPAYEGADTMSDETPEEDKTETAQTETAQSETGLTETVPSESESVSASEQLEAGTEAPWFFWILAMIPAALFATAVAVFTRRAWILRKRSRESATEIFTDMFHVLVIAEMPQEMDCMNTDFVEKVTEQFSWIDRRELEEVMDIVLRASFSGEVLGKQETLQVRSMYRHICRVLLRTMNGRQKLAFRFKEVYL